MKKLFINFPALCFLISGFAVKAQTIQNNNWLTADKTTLSYNYSPDPVLWEINVGAESTGEKEVIKLEALYNKSEHLLTITGTQINGDIEVWDVQGNTIAEKATSQNQTILKKLLNNGTYYISYSNGDYAEGVKLEVKD